MKKYISAIAALAFIFGGCKEEPFRGNDWSRQIENSAIVKEGMNRFANSSFQGYMIGLAGTTMRIDPWGFAYTKNPHTDSASYFNKPFFGYEYWWDDSGHRLNPFVVHGGYKMPGDSLLQAGKILDYSQVLDVSLGKVTTKLKLLVAETEFTSVREAFVTPDGVLVLRITDSGAPAPLYLNTRVNARVEMFGTYYAGEEEPFVKHGEGSYVAMGHAAGVITATRSHSAVSSVAVSVDGEAGTVIEQNGEIYGLDKANETVTFYLSPKSSFAPNEPSEPWKSALKTVSTAKNLGYEQLLKKTEEWWNAYYQRSSVNIPDEQLMKLYVQSLYYHGIYFGKTAIPPGCFGTDIFGFFGGVCPEYDLAFSSFALAYTNHVEETRNIAKWVCDVLPKCKEQATQGVRHHNVFRKYDKGAIYTTIMGYDGTLTIQPEPFEGRNLPQNYPGINAARMALNYLDYSDDESMKEDIYDVLKSTTYVALADLASNGKGGYCDGSIPNCMQEGAVLMGLAQCIKRGIAEPGWIEKYSGKIDYPTGPLVGEVSPYYAANPNAKSGEIVLSPGVGSPLPLGAGGSTMNYPIWWATVIDKEDPRAVGFVKNHEATLEFYCFNNGWNGIANAKIFRGDNALMWLRTFIRPDVLRDGTCFSETVYDAGKYNAPEIGAHGAFICNLTQMLLDPDSETSIDVFPAIPEEWNMLPVSFKNLLATGPIAVSAERDGDGMSIQLKNESNRAQTRIIRVRVPKFMKLKSSTRPYKLKDGFVVYKMELKPGETYDIKGEFSL